MNVDDDERMFCSEWAKRCYTESKFQPECLFVLGENQCEHSWRDTRVRGWTHPNPNVALPPRLFSWNWVLRIHEEDDDDVQRKHSWNRNDSSAGQRIRCVQVVGGKTNFCYQNVNKTSFFYRTLCFSFLFFSLWCHLTGFHNKSQFSVLRKFWNFESGHNIILLLKSSVFPSFVQLQIFL